MRVPLLVVFLGVSRMMVAQPPFITDDVGVVQVRHARFEVSTQFSVLQAAAFPNLRQLAVVGHLNYGVLHDVEVGVDAPFLAIFNAQSAGLGSPIGIGDVNLSGKWRFHHVRKNSHWPGAALAGAVELPTGSTRRQLGSGLADVGLVLLLEKPFRKVTVHTNTGLLFSGNS